MHELMSSDSSTKKHRPGPGHHARPHAPNNGAGGVLMDVSYFVVLGFEFFAD